MLWESPLLSPASDLCQHDTFTEEKGKKGTSAAAQTKGQITQVSCFRTHLCKVCLSSNRTPLAQSLSVGSVPKKTDVSYL